MLQRTRVEDPQSGTFSRTESQVSPSVHTFGTRVDEAGYTLANQTGDIANNQYYYYKQDIARIAAMGVQAYSFSIAWSRIFPFGRGQVNEEGLAHYDDVINTCLEYGVQPMVTLYHWDLPLYLQNLYGGWLSEDIVEDFAAYAQAIFERYHDRVSHFFTFNEPIVFCNTYPQPVSSVLRHEELD